VGGSGETAEDEAKKGVAICALRERSLARHDAAVDEAREWPERDMFCKRECECEAALVDVDAPAHGVERQTEERTVRGMHDEADRPPPATE
jgi:hypothetical protein